MAPEATVYVKSDIPFIRISSNRDRLMQGGDAEAQITIGAVQRKLDFNLLPKKSRSIHEFL